MRNRTAILALLLAAVASTAHADKPKRPQPAPHVAAALSTAITDALDQVESDDDFAAASRRLDELLDQVIAYVPLNYKLVYRDAAIARRLVHYLQPVAPDLRRELLAYLRANPGLARALVCAMKPGADKPVEVFAALDRLRQARGDRLDEFATLAAAICVVHDRPLKQRVNENTATAADPTILFDFFSRQERRMLFGIRKVPAELLVYVVDCTAAVDDMSWALDRYAGDTNVGARFFDIDYDHDHFRKGRPKRVNAAGWNLPNILRLGGICADQAFFAASVGKSIGVPTTYTIGKAAEGGHAWVGFLENAGGRARWNFSSGRYDVYKGVQGRVIDPQTRKSTPDSYISLLAEFVTAREEDRNFAAATNDAVRRLMAIADTGEPFAPPSPIEADLEQRRGGEIADQLELLEAGLRTCAGHAPSWMTLAQLSAQGKLTLDDKKRWAGVLHKLCGDTYPDFYMTIVAPMIESVEDVREQNRLWNAAFAAFRRPDLAAALRNRQALMWIRAGEPAKAGRCYEDVIERYANAGPFVITALHGAEKLLRRSNDPGRIVQLWGRAWQRIERPKDMAQVFFRWSNWYRVGDTYAKRLRAAGMVQQADDVLATINR